MFDDQEQPSTEGSLSQAHIYASQAELLIKRAQRSATNRRKREALERLAGVLSHVRQSVALLAGSEAR